MEYLFQQFQGFIQFFSIFFFFAGIRKNISSGMMMISKENKNFVNIDHYEKTKKKDK